MNFHSLVCTVFAALISSAWGQTPSGPCVNPQQTLGSNLPSCSVVWGGLGATAVEVRSAEAALSTADFVRIPDQDFEMQTTEVTQAQWVAVMGSNPSHFQGNDRLPVEQVSWNDVHDFLRRLNAAVAGSRYAYRLPTAEEWEFAARAGSRSLYSWGDSQDPVVIDQYAVHLENSGGRTAQVASRHPNAWGLYDMHGNVWEWTNSSLGPYREIRGGSWRSGAGDLRSAYRSSGEASFRNYVLGFRLVRTSR